MSVLLDRLQAVMAQSTPIPVIVLVFLVPYVIAYLVHIPGTRTLRLGLWPIAVLSCSWMAATVRLGPIWSVRLTCTGMSWAFGSMWAFADSPPEYHPLPRPVPYPRLRSSNAFKAFDLLINERRVGIHPFSPVLKPSSARYPRLNNVFKHVAWAIFHYSVYDLASYPAWRIDPNGIGSVKGIGGDFSAWCTDLSDQWGVPAWTVRLFFTVCLPLEALTGFCFLWHLLAFIGIASGVHLPEEWPRISNAPILSTSLNELWGRRWHQVMRHFYTSLASLLGTLSRPLHILAIFSISAATHCIMYFTTKRIWVVRPYIVFFVGNGLGCLIERAFHRYTGRRVRGLSGWLWTWSAMWYLSRGLVDWEYTTGWAGTMRDALAKEPKRSIVVNLVYMLGWGPAPADLR